MRFGLVALMILTFCIVPLTAAAQDNRVSEAEKPAKTQPARFSTRPAEPPKPPTPPATPGQIATAPAVQASAACCTKQCPGGGTCGKDCDVVDKLSQCSSNISFECPSNKGLTCVTGTCTCE